MKKITKVLIFSGLAALVMLSANANQPHKEEPRKEEIRKEKPRKEKPRKEKPRKDSPRTVSDNGATLALLGIGLVGVMAAKRKFASKK